MNLDVESIKALAATTQGRDTLVAHMAVTEACGAVVLDEVLKELAPSKLRRMVQKHRVDEAHHAGMLRQRMRELGITEDVKAVRANKERLLRLYRNVNPQTVLERYLLIQLIEEQDASLFGHVADGLRTFDPRTADMFDSMARDERAHLRYCAVVVRELGDETTQAKLDSYRALNDALRLSDSSPAEVEVYNPARHLSMLQSWSKSPLDPRALGNGLVMPGVCCGFVDGVGTTSVAYFYGLMANPALPVVTRGRAILKLAHRIHAAAVSAGYTSGITSTANPFVAKAWAKHFGSRPNGESVLIGEL